jgi:hypothetical protein
VEQPSACELNRLLACCFGGRDAGITLFSTRKMRWQGSRKGKKDSPPVFFLKLFARDPDRKAGPTIPTSAYDFQLI